ACDLNGIHFDEAVDRLEESARQGGINAVLDQLFEAKLNRLIVIDATASDEVAHQYPELLERSISIITPNKRANTKDQAFYERIQRARSEEHTSELQSRENLVCRLL